MIKRDTFYYICSLIFINLGALGRGMCYAIYITGAGIGKVDSPSKAIAFMIFFAAIEVAGVIGLEVSSN